MMLVLCIHRLAACPQFVLHKMSLKLQVYAVCTNWEGTSRHATWLSLSLLKGQHSCFLRVTNVLLPVGGGVKRGDLEIWPTVCTVQHLGKAKQSSCLWQGRMKAVQLGSSRRGSSAFCRVFEPRPPYKFFLSLPKCQIRFQDWNNSGYFPPLRGDLRVYFSMYTYPLTKGRYLE